MFFENQGALIAAYDVLYFQTGKVNVSHNTDRKYHAITLRKKADTVLSYGDKKVCLSGKSIVFVPAGLSYVRKARDEEMVVIHFLSGEIAEKDIKVFVPEKIDAFEKLFDEILRVWKNKEEGYRLKAGEILFHILHKITVEEQNRRDRSVSSRAAGLIRKNAENAGFSVSELEGALNISGAYLRRLFKEEYGMSPKEYLTECRMEIARSLLLTGYFNVGEVARRSGFENEKYFSTVFKEHCGSSPKMYGKPALPSSAQAEKAACEHALFLPVADE